VDLVALTQGQPTDMNQKQRAIDRVTPPGTAAGRYQPADPLLAFLDSR
jgi:integrase/recombinase XerD